MLVFTHGAFKPDAEVVTSMREAMFDAASGHSEFFGEEIASKA